MADTFTRMEPETASKLASQALRFARRAHLGQYRKQTHEQFVEHPIAVARLLSEEGFDGPVIAAAYLHDVVEKTDVGLAEIRRRFGPEVAELVATLTEDAAIEGYASRKRELRGRVIQAGRPAALIYAADRLVNMRDWRQVEPSRRERIGVRLRTGLPERLELWQEDLEELTELDDGLPFLAGVEIELTVLRTDAERQAA